MDWFFTQLQMTLLWSGSGQIVEYFKPLVVQSDDRLKGNGEIIENVCETLSKLKQVCDKSQTWKMMTQLLGLKKVN